MIVKVLYSLVFSAHYNIFKMSNFPSDQIISEAKHQDLTEKNHRITSKRSGYHVFVEPTLETEPYVMGWLNWKNLLSRPKHILLVLCHPISTSKIW